MARRKKNRKSSSVLEVINPAPAGIDLSSKSHWGCGPHTNTGEQQVKELSTDTPPLQELAE